MTRRLALRSETLSELSTGDLAVVHGASGVTCYCTNSDNLRSCALVAAITTAVVTPSCP